MSSATELTSASDLQATRRAARRNQTWALYNMGRYYQVENPNAPLAYEHYVAAAKRGNAFAQTNLSTLLLTDHPDLPKDHPQALYWAKRASRQNVPEAMIMVGYMYVLGYGTERNHDRAFQYFSKAAQLDCISQKSKGNALYNLAMCHVRGYGTERNIPKGLELLNAAQACGDKYATVMIAERHIRGVGGIPRASMHGFDILSRATGDGNLIANDRLEDVTTAMLLKRPERLRELGFKAAQTAAL